MSTENFVTFNDIDPVIAKIGQRLSSLNGAYTFKGNVTFANLPAVLTESMNGYTYNVTEDFVTDERFIEGAGIACDAGTNVSVADLSTYAEVTPAGSENPSEEGWYELVNSKYVLSTDTEIQTGTTYYEKTVSVKFDTTGLFVNIAEIENKIAKVARNFAPEFSAEATYRSGEYVIYEGELYRFIANHDAGAWNPDHVDDKDIIEVINTETIALYQQLNKVANDIAPLFNAENAYSVGELVRYGAELYKFKSAHTAGDPWNLSEVDPATIEEELEILKTAIDNISGDLVGLLAPAFSSETSYIPGDLVNYQGALYKFIANHTGAWDSSHVTATTIDQILDRIAVYSAPVFNATLGYKAGSYVLYNNTLWKFIANHTAGTDWDANEVINTSIANELTMYSNALKNTRDCLSEKLFVPTTTNFTAGDIAINPITTKLIEVIKDFTAGDAGSGAYVDVTVDTLINSLRAALAPRFDKTAAYAGNDLVWYGSQLFIFITNHAAGPWDASEVNPYTLNDIVNKANNNFDSIASIVNHIAPELSTEASYSAGDIVKVTNHSTKKLMGIYKFKTDHTPGAIQPGEVDAVKISDLIESAEPASLTPAQKSTLLGYLD